MIIIASILAIAIGLGIIYISWKDYKAIDHDIDLLRTYSETKGRIKIPAKIVSLGINTDYPTSVLEWPQEDDYDDKEAFQKAVDKASESNSEALRRVEVFGNFKIEYEYIAPDGNTYISRTVSRIPDMYPLESMYKLKIGGKMTAYVNPEEYSDSILKKTDPDAFKKYRKQIQKPQKAKMVVGLIVSIMGMVSPWMPWTFVVSG